MSRFNLRQLLWLTTVVAIAIPLVGWLLPRSGDEIIVHVVVLAVTLPGLAASLLLIRRPSNSGPWALGYGGAYVVTSLALAGILDGLSFKPTTYLGMLVPAFVLSVFWMWILQIPALSWLLGVWVYQKLRG